MVPSKINQGKHQLVPPICFSIIFYDIHIELWIQLHDEKESTNKIHM